MPSLDEFARQRLSTLEQAHLRRTLVPTSRFGDLWVERNGHVCCRSRGDYWP
jgi:hypothetical protein